MRVHEAFVVVVRIIVGCEVSVMQSVVLHPVIYGALVNEIKCYLHVVFLYPLSYNVATRSTFDDTFDVMVEQLSAGYG